VLKSILVVK
jgi:hypothetical protein